MNAETIMQEELNKTTSDWIDEQGDTLQYPIGLTTDDSEEYCPKVEAQKWAKGLPDSE